MWLIVQFHRAYLESTTIAIKCCQKQAAFRHCHHLDLAIRYPTPCSYCRQSSLVGGFSRRGRSRVVSHRIASTVAPTIGFARETHRAIVVVSDLHVALSSLHAWCQVATIVLQGSASLAGQQSVLAARRCFFTILYMVWLGYILVTYYVN